MAESILNGKHVLAVDDEPDILETVVDEITAAAPACRVDTARTYEAAAEMIAAGGYDLVVLDIMGVSGFELLKKAVSFGVPAVMLTAHALSPAALKQPIASGARAYLPKDRLIDIAQFLAEVLQSEELATWGRLFEDLRGYFDDHWGADWKSADEEFWKRFESRLPRPPEKA